MSMTGRRSTGTRGDAPLWRDEPAEAQEQAQAGARAEAEAAAEAAAHPVPAQRGPHRDERRAAPADDGGARPGRAARREAGREAGREVTAPNRMPAVLPALGLPVLGALGDELLAPGLGAVYAAAALLGAALAALVATRAGWWWVVSGAPVVTLAVAGGVDYLARGDKYHGAGIGTEGLKLVSAQFPWMLAALAAALLAVGVRLLRVRLLRARRAGRAGRTGRSRRD
ncbi:hypothetical protein KSE_01920 [Kitasatospora setae KM-6054]|uniref:DUF6542 domain-containing protein n=2 Tax=Streptomycetaceae TaxID=2062 RepID=E4N4B1_KITSK|nr:hypothetical protein KSE_01920 [Kitasatospora setae KM-6054]